jgi:uncharacterized protein
MRNSLALLATAAAISSILLSSCASDTAASQATQQFGLANPASVNCEQRGGKLQIADSPQGQSGICHFSNGTQCEEWALLRGECSPDKK